MIGRVSWVIWVSGHKIWPTVSSDQYYEREIKFTKKTSSNPWKAVQKEPAVCDGKDLINDNDNDNDND